MAQTGEDISPIGRTAREAAQGRAARSDAYKAQHDATAGPRQIAKQIILYRTRNGLSQEELAARVGTSLSHISRIESGRHATSVKTLRRIGDALGLRLVMTFAPTEVDPSLEAIEAGRATNVVTIKKLSLRKSATHARDLVRS